MYLKVIIGICFVKLLLFPTYRSTDFEVHRNWLAITHSLPVDQWYVDETSQWTLDYPPFFAYFQFLLSQIGQFFDKKMLIVQNLNYSSDMTVLFQRLSVIITDLVFAYSSLQCMKEVKMGTGHKADSTFEGWVLLVANAGLLIVDHIHFQYNGFLYGILFLSIARMLQKRELEAAFWFCVLLNLKHIFCYIAPAYFIYLLRSYCLTSMVYHKDIIKEFNIARFLKLGCIVSCVFALSLLPFAMLGQPVQLLKRLFPFKRGLSHAYWAPNFWALYNFADKVLVLFGEQFGYHFQSSKGSFTSGLVQESFHSVLPSITPMTTFIITFMSVMPCLIKLWYYPCNSWMFVRCLVLCGFSSFMFGWHVHEKAILLVILPFMLFCLQSQIEARLSIILTFVGHFSLFPLIYTNEETIFKVCLVIFHGLYLCQYIKRNWLYVIKRQKKWMPFPLLEVVETIYILGLIPLFLYEQFIHSFIGLQSVLPFMPLMLISVYCSLGIFICWISFYYTVLFQPHITKSKIS